MLTELDANWMISPKESELMRFARRFPRTEKSNASFPSRGLSFVDIQRRLHQLFLCRDADVDSDGGTHAERVAEHIRQTFSECLDNADEDTVRLLQPLHARWRSEGHEVLLSTKIMDVLRFKRDFFRQGSEASFQDFADWVALAGLLRETVQAPIILEYAMRLGPSCREAVCDVLDRENEEQDGGAVDCAALHRQLCRRVTAPLSLVSGFTGRNYVMAFDELVETDELVYNSINRHDVQRLVGSARRGICDSLFDFATNYLTYKLRPETYFLGVALLDRYIALRPVSREHLVLVGCASLLLASKYEEIFAIDLKKFLDCASRSMTQPLLLKTEEHIMQTLGYQIGTTTISHAASALLLDQDPPATREQQDAVRYITTAVTLHSPLGDYRQTFLAAAAVYISRLVCGIPTGEPSEGVRHLIPEVLAALDKCAPEGKRCAVYTTFSTDSFHRVSILNYRDLFPLS